LPINSTSFNKPVICFDGVLKEWLIFSLQPFVAVMFSNSAEDKIVDNGCETRGCHRDKTGFKFSSFSLFKALRMFSSCAGDVGGDTADCVGFRQRRSRGLIERYV